jgi:hypothetical protein
MSHPPYLIADGQMTKLNHDVPSDVGWQIQLQFVEVGRNVLAGNCVML